MASDALLVDSSPDPGDVDFLQEQINRFNVAATGVSDGKPMAFYVRDQDGSIIAGLYGWTWGGCCEVRFLWVAESHRHLGHGSRLLAAAEQEAAARGCPQVILDTHEFQAPLFYQRHGYEIYGVVEDYPRGYHKYYFRKALNNQAMAPNLQSDPPMQQGE